MRGCLDAGAEEVSHSRGGGQHTTDFILGVTHVPAAVDRAFRNAVSPFLTTPFTRADRTREMTDQTRSAPDKAGGWAHGLV